MFWYFLIVAWLHHVAVSAIDLTEVQCDPDLVEGYIVPDPVYCDRYLDCDLVTGQAVLLCPAGQGVDLVRGVCRDRVDCGSRQQLWRDQVTSKPLVKKVLTRGDPLQVTTVIPLLSSTLPPVDPLAGLVCEKSVGGYTVPDPEQCDRYVECSPGGVKTEKLCPDGLALSLQTGVCDYLVVTDCQDRPRLQQPKGSGPCIRVNGRYPVETCDQFLDCRAGEWDVQGCAVGVVFDEVKGCVHPDETDRPGCRAADQFDIQCPYYGPYARLRFGDHDRLPHPKNCNLFYACLRKGLPRLNTCPRPLVFNPKSGFCDDKKNVPGCEGGNISGGNNIDRVKITEEIREKITEEITEQLFKQFGLPARSRVVRSESSMPLHRKTVLFENQRTVRIKMTKKGKTKHFKKGSIA